MSESHSASHVAQLFEWLEEHKAQVWYDSKQAQWTLFLRVPGKRIPIQPSAPTLFEVVTKAREKLASLQNENPSS